jgi:fumarylacetoacetate (FAA) hydrolase family protein
MRLDPSTSLPRDGSRGTIVGRVWLPGEPSGPAVVVLREDGVYDISNFTPTVGEFENCHIGFRKQSGKFSYACVTEFSKNPWLRSILSFSLKML